jgi:hypothetical protein
MIALLRPWLGRLASRRLWTTFAVLASVACSNSTEVRAVRSESENQAAAAGATPTAPDSQRGATCAPVVSGLEPSDIEPTEIDCPAGYLRRDELSGLPTAGRFRTDAELMAAFCIEAMRTRVPTASEPQQPLFGPRPESTTDFEANDVVAYAFDQRNGTKPALFRRGNDLWLRVTSMTCSAAPPELASIAFVVPKGTTINEQRCSLKCQ